MYYLLARDRARRNINPRSRFGNTDMIYYALSVAEIVEYQEPSSYREAVTCDDSEQWIIAMREELEYLEKNKTWVLVDRPKTQKLIGCKWLFKKKLEITNKEGEV